MKYHVYVNIMPHEAILDPAGKATLHGLHSLGFQGVSAVRIGKRIQLLVEATSEAAAHQLADEAARKLLCNLITEQFTIETIALATA